MNTAPVLGAEPDPVLDPEAYACWKARKFHAEHDKPAAAAVYRPSDTGEGVAPAPRIRGCAEPPKPKYAGLTAVRSFYGSVSFAWNGYFPNGHVALLVGPQGVGKSYMAAYSLSVFAGRREQWPDGSEYIGTPGPVVLVDTEEMRGAYAERLNKWGVSDGDVIIPTPTGDVSYTCRLPADCKLIETLARDLKASGVVVDSLSGGHGLDENSAAMRTILQRLTEMAGHLQVPVIAVHHCKKRSQLEPVRLTLDRVRGSSTISQFARSVVGLYRLDEHNLTAPVRVESLKCSFCRPPEPFGFTITDAGLDFHEAPEEARPVTAKDRAAEFLQVELDHTQARYTDLLEKAEAQGISKNALYRAREALHVVTWNGFWGLPSRQGDKGEMGE